MGLTGFSGVTETGLLTGDCPTPTDDWPADGFEATATRGLLVPDAAPLGIFPGFRVGLDSGLCTFCCVGFVRETVGEERGSGLCLLAELPTVDAWSSFVLFRSKRLYSSRVPGLIGPTSTPSSFSFLRSSVSSDIF